MHYARWRRHGDPLTTKVHSKKPCGVDVCDRLAHAHGYCTKHFARWKKHGDVHAVSPGGRPLKGEVLSWRGVHKRLYRTRGPAKSMKCVDCGGAANEWSYNNADPNELHEYIGESLCAYSLSLEHYEPRCTSCHRKFDLLARHEKDSAAGSGVGNQKG